MSKKQNKSSAESAVYFFAGGKKKSPFYYPISTGHIKCDNDYLFSNKISDSIVIVYIKSGLLEFGCKDKECTAHNNEIAVIDCFNHRFCRAVNGIEAYWIHIGGADIKRLYNELSAEIGNLITANNHIIEKIKSLHVSVKNNSVIVDSKMSLMIYDLIINLFLAEKNTSSTKNSLQKTLDFIFENYAKPITVNDIAKEVHMSASNFAKIFKKQYGTSPYDCLLRVRLSKSKELLKNTDMAISEIAYKTGFTSDSCFINFFKREESISPLQFRKTMF